MDNFFKLIWEEKKHWIDVFTIFVLLEILYIIVWWPAFGKVDITKELWQMVIPVAKDTISAGITATSILLPSTLAVMALIETRNINAILLKNTICELFLAILCFIFSLWIAIFNFSHFPIQLKENIHISFNAIIGILVITQFILLSIGIWKLLRASYYFKNELLNRLRSQT